MPLQMTGGGSGDNSDYRPTPPPTQNQPVSQSGPVATPPGTVDFDGATSGDGSDYRPPWEGFQRQPVRDTSNNTGVGPGVKLCSDYSKSTHKPWNAAVPNVPKGGSPDDGAI